VAVTSNPSLAGFNFLWYIRDVGDGKTTYDQYATNGGFGLTCAAGPQGVFIPIASGDFKAFSN
jgi:hypothetical protein